MHYLTVLLLATLAVACYQPMPFQAPSATTVATPTATVASPAMLPTAPSASGFLLVIAAIPDGIPAYNRDEWIHWIDQDQDCENTRAEVLIDESLEPVTLDRCRVAAGRWFAPYTGTLVVAAGKLDVDHMVPLANAHASGGWAWGSDRKRAYANDLMDADHLIAVTASANRSKGSRGPEEWRPPDTSYWCEYAADWVRIKVTWELTVTAAEGFALDEMLDTCAVWPLGTMTGDDAAIGPIPTPVPAGGNGGDLLYDPFGTDRNCGDFPSWRAAQVFYKAAGGPATDRHRLDGDGDGVACQSLPGAP